MSKIVPTLGHSTSRFNEQLLDEGRAASTGSLRECRFWTTDVVGPLKIDAAICAFDLETVKRFGFFRQPAFFGQPFMDLCFGIEIRASRRAIPYTFHQ
jgi:hypothetical protein